MSYTPTEIAIYSAVVQEVILSSKKMFDVNNIKENEFVKEIYSIIPDYPRDYYFYLEELNFQTDNDEIEDFSDSEIEKYDDRKRAFYIRFSEDIDTLSGGLFSINAATGMIEVDLESARPMQAIMLDGMVRYDCTGDSLLQYVFSALGIMERFGFDDMQNENWPMELSV